MTHEYTRGARVFYQGNPRIVLGKIGGIYVLDSPKGKGFRSVADLAWPSELSPFLESNKDMKFVLQRYDN